MEKPTLLSQIENDTALQDALDWPFDFQLEPITNITNVWPVRTNDELEVFGSEGAGGVFTFWGKGDLNALPVVYISSEGEIGKISNNLFEFFSLIVFLTSWKDLTIYSGKNQLNEMREKSLELEDEILDDEPEFRKLQREVSSKMALANGKNVLENFHAISVQAAYPTVFDASDGSQYESLFTQY